MTHLLGQNRSSSYYLISSPSPLDTVGVGNGVGEGIEWERGEETSSRVTVNCVDLRFSVKHTR